MAWRFVVFGGGCCRKMSEVNEVSEVDETKGFVFGAGRKVYGAMRRTLDADLMSEEQYKAISSLFGQKPDGPDFASIDSQEEKRKENNCEIKPGLIGRPVKRKAIGYQRGPSGELIEITDQSPRFGLVDETGKPIGPRWFGDTTWACACVEGERDPYAPKPVPPIDPTRVLCGLLTEREWINEQANRPIYERMKELAAEASISERTKRIDSELGGAYFLNKRLMTEWVECLNPEIGSWERRRQYRKYGLHGW